MLRKNILFLIIVNCLKFGVGFKIIGGGSTFQGREGNGAFGEWRDVREFRGA